MVIYSVFNYISDIMISIHGELFRNFVNISTSHSVTFAFFRLSSIIRSAEQNSFIVLFYILY